jgi:hypothetical protein
VSKKQEELIMRLRVREGRVIAQFSFPWEAVALEALDACWMPLSLPEHPDQPIGAIHSATHEVRLRASQVVADRQVVVLGPTPISDVPD